MQIPLLKGAAEAVAIARIEMCTIGWMVVWIFSLLDLYHAIGVILVGTFTASPGGLGERCKLAIDPALSLCACQVTCGDRELLTTWRVDPA